jgi:protein involved in polysaccharide export with SLBB domain
MKAIMKNVSLWVLLSCLLLGSCTAAIRPQEQIPEGFQVWNDTLPEFTFMPGDELDVEFIFNSELNGRAIVAPDGHIDLPLIGSVQALNRTPEELANDLQMRYATELLRPDLTVIPKQYGSHIVCVGGEVQRPGFFKLEYQMGILEGILKAGGFLNTARMDEVVLIRRNSQNKPMLKIVNARQIIEGKVDREGHDLSNVPLQRLDVVYVPKSSVAEVNLWINEYIHRMLPFSRNFNYTINRGLPGYLVR